jgi:hypothetical protein
LYCNDDGGYVGIDGVVSEVISEREKVVIRGIIPKPAPFAWHE